MILLFQLKILRNVVWMVAMATECCRMSEGGCSEGIMVLQCDKTGTFIHEIARRITSKYKLQCHKLKDFLIYTNINSQPCRVLWLISHCCLEQYIFSDPEISAPDKREFKNDKSGIILNESICFDSFLEDFSDNVVVTN